MKQMEIIEGVLRRTGRRQRWQAAWKGLWAGLLAGSVVWLLALLAYKVFPISGWVLVTAGGVACLAMAAGFIEGWRSRPTLIQTARWVDARTRLEERLSTALEVAGSPASGEWRELLITDAARRAGEVDPKQLLPYGLPRASRWALLSLALAAGLGFVPEYRSQSYLQKQRDAEIIKETGRTLAELTRRNIEKRPPALEPTRQSLETVAELGDQMAKARLTRDDALRDLASVTEKLQDQARELSRNPTLKAMEKAARESTPGSAQGKADLQKQIESLQKSMENQTGDSKALEKLGKDLQKAKEAAAALANSKAGTGDAAKDQLQKALSDLARSAKDLGVSLPSLDEAIAALSASQTDQMLKDLATAETDLEKLQQMAKALAQLQAQAEKLGKDLAEQLQNGQAEAAQATLQKMIQGLQTANLDKGALEKMIDEVSKAIEPAGQYGKAADFLKQGAQQMKGGQKGAAAASLADAAKELQKMLQELGDGQAILASLEALQKAQMCVGNGQCWGQSQGQGPPRAGKGGGVGSGVGTWGDDSRLMDITQIKDRWDNSGVKRPDMDARGIADRGDAQLSDKVLPTKVKGQMNPGGPMPSITLKGVSVKGQSKVAYSEMVTAAQADAQAALSQDQVPRAYQGAVRDYFDDLKK